jgi:hypothetical protein
VRRKHFDDDVRDLVKVRVVHGFWKNDDERRINLLVWAVIFLLLWYAFELTKS